MDSPGRDEHGNPFSRERVERALKDQIVPKVLPLKVGAVVMLVKVRNRAIYHSVPHKFKRNRAGGRRILFKEF